MAPIGTLWGIPIQRQTKVVRHDVEASGLTRHDLLTHGQILAAAAVAGLELETPPVEFHVTNKSPEFLSKFPMGKMPAFEDAKGLKLFEGAPIARHGKLHSFLASN